MTPNIPFSPQNWSVFLGNFNFSDTPSMPMSSLQDTRNLGLIVLSSLGFALGSSFLATYGTYLWSALFLVDTSLLLIERFQLFSLYLGCLKCELPFFLSTTSIWAITRWHTSDNDSTELLIKESLNGLAVIPCTKAATTISSSWVCSLTETAQYLFKCSLSDSPSLCLSLKRSYNIRDWPY